MKYPHIFLSLLLAASSADAAVVSFNNSLSATTDSANFHAPPLPGGITPTSTVVLKDSAGNPLPVGTDFRIGFIIGYSAALDALLGVEPYEILTNPTNPNRFVPIGIGVSGTGDDARANMEIKSLGGTPRVISSFANVTYLPGTANALAVGGVNEGTKLFLLLVNQTNIPVTDALPSINSTTTEWGLYSATAWTIPVGGGANLALAFKEVDTPGEVFRGSLGSLRTAPVPEPTVITFGFAALGLALARRRRA